MDDLLILVRAVHFASSAMFAGGVVFVRVIADPAFQTAEPPSVMRPMRWLLYGNFAVAVASWVAWLYVLASRIVDRPLPEVVFDDTAWTLLTQTQFGSLWKWHLLGAVLVALALWLAPSGQRSSRSVVIAAAVLSALFLGSLAFAGHGVATEGALGYLHLGADVLHLISAGAWLGGLPALALLLLWAKQSDPAGSDAIVYRVTRRFSDFGIFVVGVLLASGLINTWFMTGSVQALTGTDYGQLLLIKIGLFGAMVLLAAANRLLYLPPLRPADGEGASGKAKVLRRLLRNTVGEIVLGLAVMLIVGALGVMVPASDLALHVH